MHVQTVAKYIRRSPYQSVAASLIMSLTFLAVAVFAIITIISVRAIDYFEARPQLSIFLTDEAQRSEIDQLSQQMQSTGKAQSVKFVSKEEALKIYQKQNQDDQLLLDLVTADILPASLDVQAYDATDLASLAQIAQGSTIVEEVVYQEDIVNTLTQFTNGVRQIGIAIIGVLVLVSIFVILTIIGIKITVRRDEIEIMKLIGASNWFIRTPFILEGMFYGAVGAIVGWGIAYAVLYFYATPQIEEFFGKIPVLPIDPIFMLGILGGLFLSAIILGAFSSFLAVLRYLK